MELNRGQEECLHRLKHWWRRKDKQVFEISGAAGTGKTTIVKILIESLGLKPSEVAFMAFVGKAAMALSRTGVVAKTVHASIYYPVDVPKRDKSGNIITINGRAVTKVIFKKRDHLDGNVKLIVVDEAPMINGIIGRDILSFGIPVIALGDLNQLPPIYGDSFFLRRPDVILTEIMRQNKDNPIIRISQDVINDKRLTYGVIDNSVFITRRSLQNDAVFTMADINICGRNTTRDKINNLVRHTLLKIDSESPVRNDKMICRQNVWSKCMFNNIYLVNGLIGYITDIDYESFDGRSMTISFRPEFLKESFEDIPLDYKYLYLPYKDKITKHYIPNGIRFEFGYCITCHLAQGSQYKTVLVVNERIGDYQYYKKWLYTAITRSQEKIIILL